MTRLRIDTEDPLVGTNDPAVAITEALKKLIEVRTREAEFKAKYRAKFDDPPS